MVGPGGPRAWAGWGRVVRALPLGRAGWRIALPHLLQLHRLRRRSRGRLGGIPARLRQRRLGSRLDSAPDVGETHAEGCPAPRPLASLPPLPGRLQPRGGLSPASLALWEQFLVYSIALGVAEQVLEAARLHAPPEVAQGSSFYSPGYDRSVSGPAGLSLSNVEDDFPGAFSPPSSSGSWSGGGGGGSPEAVVASMVAAGESPHSRS